LVQHYCRVGLYFLNWSSPGKVRMHCDMHTLKRTNTAMSEHSVTKMANIRL